jgi:hypothetical protein
MHEAITNTYEANTIMRETITTLEDYCTAALSTGETARVADDDNCLAPDAAPRAYLALTERPADLTEIFAPARRQFVAAAVTYKALKEPPLDFNRMDLLASPRRLLAEQNEPTYRVFTGPTADFTKIVAVEEVTVVPEIVATPEEPEELEALSNRTTEEISPCGKKLLVEPPAGYARRESLLTPEHHPPVVARRAPQTTD